MSTDSVKVNWLGSPPHDNFGTTFGLPWPRGRHFPDKTTFTCGENGSRVQSWNTAYWPDGSIKWTAHAIPAGKPAEGGYSVHASGNPPSTDGVSGIAESSPLTVCSKDDSIDVDTGKIKLSFAKSGRSIIQSITASNGKVVGRDGELVLLSQSSIPDEGVPDGLASHHEFRGSAEEVVVEQAGPIRAVVSVKGRHRDIRDGDGAQPRHGPWLPFVLRFYLYANSELVRVVHSIMYDGDGHRDHIRGIGVRFAIPLGDEPAYDRHIRFSGHGGGVLSESAQGVTGLWKDPRQHVREAQVEGRAAPLETWSPDFVPRLRWVPVWNDYSLSQLSADGFNLRKRTKAGHSWVGIPSGSRAGGLVYLGGASTGGLAVGLRDFWERYPTGLDIRNAGREAGEVTTWLYSPSAGPMDLRPYHDGLQQKTHEDQLDALAVTYEDWEPELGTPYGIARTNELFILAADRTPEAETLSKLTEYLRNPPLLVAGPEALCRTKAFGTYWSPSPPPSSSTPAERDVEKKLDFLFRFYEGQIAQRRWYGFWDHGDIMHTYDADRHTWRYDVGGYAWDNSELSPDLWLWLYFLRTGRADVYRMAEALTRHTGEVDVYHIGKYKGLGTRHGVQHWSDSCKQARISNALYRRFFYYLSGADERTGDLLRETLETEKTYLVLDPYRKVRKDKDSYEPNPAAVTISLGTEWSALAAAWFAEWERRGPQWEEARAKLLSTMKGIGLLAEGFVTGRASYNLLSGEISPPPQDPANKGIVQVSHLSAMFGLFEICAELLDAFGAEEVPPGFEKAWLEYCRYFNAAPDEQLERFGASFGNLQLRQGHSRLTAFAARTHGDADLARRAWKEFGFGDGYGPDTPWKSEVIDGSRVLVRVEEATWVSTNITALYGLAAIQNLALLGDGRLNIPPE